MKYLKALVALLCCFPSFLIHGQIANKQPNILLIYTDDHRYSGIRALMQQEVETPNIDQLIAEGVSFDKTYLMGAFTGATCTPSRAMLLTGKQLFNLEGQGHTIPATHSTLPETLEDAGYHTYHVGKWHNDMASLARMFKDGARVSGKPVYLTDQFRMPFSDWKKDGDYTKKDSYLLQYDAEGNIVKIPITGKEKKGPTGTEANGPHVSEVLADASIDFLEGYSKKEPFFMYLAFPTPHDPRQAPKIYKDKYPPAEIQLPPSFMAQHPFDNGHMVLRDEELAPWPRTPEVIKKHLSDYYAIITHLDAQIGRVVASLKEQGLYENTLIVLAGDSGLAVGNHGLMGKQNIYDEDGIHVPFIISGGALAKPYKNKRITSFAYIHDIMPTVLDLVGVPVPQTIDGKSLVPVLKADAKQVRESTYHAYLQFQRAYRQGDYKLIEYVRAPNRKGSLSGSRVTQLFNITKDPWEQLDLAAMPDYEPILSRLQAAMRNEATRLKDVADTERSISHFWDYY